jgi:cytochrome b involved in lipid metabolism
MPSAQVDAPQSETENGQVETEDGESSEAEQSSEQSAEPTEKPSAKPEADETKEASPSPTPTKTTEPSPTPTKTQAGYTMAQVAEKNSQSACWVVIDGMVYDLTDWIRQHPGGRSAILSLCGTDGTSGFMAQHGGRAGPSSALDRYVLGPLSN